MGPPARPPAKRPPDAWYDNPAWWEVQLPLCAAKDLFALKMWDPGSGHLHLWKLAERLFNLLCITATSGHHEPQFLL
jgi:hypothetical protein